MNSRPAGLPTPDAIHEAVRARREWGVAALQKLIVVDSVAPHERACQEILRDLLQAEGLHAQTVPLDDGSLVATPGFIDRGLPLEDRPNLVVALGGSHDGCRSLILNSHIDTVVWREEQHKWRAHPLSGQVRDERIYGRGAVDAKGQLMTAIMAVLALRDLGHDPGGRLIVESAVCEEPTGNGTLALCAQGWLADAAIVLEPNDNQVAHGHRGVIALRFEVEERSGHAAVTSGNANAIVQVCRLAEVLATALDGWSSPADTLYGPPTLNVGRIEGGQDIFTTPHHCEIQCGVRYAPGTYDALSCKIQEHVKCEAAMRGLKPLEWNDTTIVNYDAAEIPPDSLCVKTLLECLKEVEPLARLSTCPGTCDARHFINRYGVPAVVFGPGQMTMAHSVDEHMPIEQWLRASEALGRFIVRWCN